MRAIILSVQFPDVDAGAHVSTADNAIASAQNDVVIAFIRHKTTPKLPSPDVETACTG